LEIKLLRTKKTADYTVGELYIDNKKKCYTLEDTVRDKKIKHETAIPKGTYKVKLRKYGTTHERYENRFGDLHKGTLEICDVPNYTDVLIHIGNSNIDTSGCILVGERERNGWLFSSTKAYMKIYEIISEALLRDEDVYIEIKEI
jgi:hypothetical protein